MTLRRGLLGAILFGLLGACDPVQPRVSEDGAYVLLAVDVSVVRQRRLEEVGDRMAERLRAQAIRYWGRGVVDDAARIRLIDPADTRRALEALNGLPNVTLSESEGGSAVDARLTDAATEALTTQALPEAINVLQRRLYRRGVSVAQHDADHIIARTSQPTFPRELLPILTKQALLTFHLVREARSLDPLDPPPPGAMVVRPHPDFGQRAEVVQRRPLLTGERLMRADATFDPNASEPVLSFQLDRAGTEQFCRITREHVRERFAVLLDNEVLTAPRINEAICGGAGQISGNFTRETVQALAIMLNAGALPAPLIILQEGVGPVGEVG